MYYKILEAVDKETVEREFWVSIGFWEWLWLKITQPWNVGTSKDWLKVTSNE